MAGVERLEWLHPLVVPKICSALAPNFDHYASPPRCFRHRRRVGGSPVHAENRVLLEFEFLHSYKKIPTPPCGIGIFGRGRETRTPGTRFWRQCHIKRTVQIVPTVEPFVLLALLNLMPFDALLMLLKIPCKFDAQLPKNRHA